MCLLFGADSKEPFRKVDYSCKSLQLNHLIPSHFFISLSPLSHTYLSILLFRQILPTPSSVLSVPSLPIYNFQPECFTSWTSHFPPSPSFQYPFLFSFLPLPSLHLLTLNLFPSFSFPLSLSTRTHLALLSLFHCLLSYLPSLVSLVFSSYILLPPALHFTPFYISYLTPLP